MAAARAAAMAAAALEGRAAWLAGVRGPQGQARRPGAAPAPAGGRRAKDGWLEQGARPGVVALSAGGAEQSARRGPPRASAASLDVAGTSQGVSEAGTSAAARPAPPVDPGEFPCLDQCDESGRRLVYLDSAATSQKPRAVLYAMNAFWEHDNANVHRGVHTLSARATTAYEGARADVARFVNARSDREIVFTRNASEAINLVAYSWGSAFLKPGDEIILSVAEHHSNLVPWQLIAQRTGAVLRHVRLAADETLDMEHFRSLLSPRTKLVSLVYVSNTLGSILPAREVVDLAHAQGAKVLLDGCQAVPHMPVDVQQLGCDWLVASGHKMCGTGVGFLYGRQEVLREMPPFLGGGEMIREVFLDHSTFADPPSRFEAGTPAIGEAIGLGAACRYLSAVGMDRVHDYEEAIGRYLYTELAAVPGVRILGPKPRPEGPGRAALCSFVVDGVHPTDLSTLLDVFAAVAIRSGHHCTQPLHRELGLASSARASLYIYNTFDEVDAFVAALRSALADLKQVAPPIEPSDTVGAVDAAVPS